MLVNYINQIITAYQEHHEQGRFVLAIDGLSRSGKTTLVEQLRTEILKLDVPVIILHIDDYIVERKKRYNTGQESWFEYYFLQWDVTFLKENMFKSLKTSNKLILPRYQDESDIHIEEIIDLPQNCLIIIEGVFLLREEWREFLDYIIYLDCPKETRFSRESEHTQMNVEKFVHRYWKAEDYYLNTIQPHKYADLIVNS